MKIGFIGLGIMGKPMARNLLKAGHQLVVYDIVKEAIGDAVAAGAVAAASPKEVAQACDRIITMLPNSPHVKTAVLGANGVLEGAKSGTLLIDMSSIAPGAAQEIAAECKKDKRVKGINLSRNFGQHYAITAGMSYVRGE